MHELWQPYNIYSYFIADKEINAENTKVLNISRTQTKHMHPTNIPVKSSTIWHRDSGGGVVVGVTVESMKGSSSKETVSWKA